MREESTDCQAIETLPGPLAGTVITPKKAYQLLQVAPTVAYQVTDRLSVGFAPLLNMARLEVSPGVFVYAERSLTGTVSMAEKTCRK